MPRASGCGSTDRSYSPSVRAEPVETGDCADAGEHDVRHRVRPHDDIAPERHLITDRQGQPSMCAWRHHVLPTYASSARTWNDADLCSVALRLEPRPAVSKAECAV